MGYADPDLTLPSPTTGDSVPAAHLQQLRDNDVFFAGKASATVLTEQTTTSTSYTDLATSGPAVTVETGTSAYVQISALMYQTTGGIGWVSCAVSGATSVAANDDNGMPYNSTTAGQCFSRGILFTGLTPGSNTFTMKYRTTANTLNAGRRTILVEPLA